jgi:hypothetical protein
MDEDLVRFLRPLRVEELFAEPVGAAPGQRLGVNFMRAQEETLNVLLDKDQRVMSLQQSQMGAIGLSCVIWDAGLFMVDFLSALGNPLGTVLDLGCGVGISGLAALEFGASKVVFTDVVQSSLVLENIETVNEGKNSSAKFVAYDWSHDSPPKEILMSESIDGFDVPWETILCSDVIYDDNARGPLLKLLRNISFQRMFLAYKRRHDEPERAFLDELATWCQLSVVDAALVPLLNIPDASLAGLHIIVAIPKVRLEFMHETTIENMISDAEMGDIVGTQLEPTEEKVMSDLEIHDIVETQLATIELMEAAYPDQFSLKDSSKESVINLRAAIEQNDTHSAKLLRRRDDALSFSIKVTEKSTIVIRLPPLYPDEALRFEIHSLELSRSKESSLKQALHEIIQLNYGADCCFELVQEACGYCISNASTNADAHGGSQDKLDTDSSYKIAQFLIYFHHIKSPIKMRHIEEEAENLQLGGLWKKDFPGIVIIEGDYRDTLEWVRRIQQLRWQHMVVRGECISEVATKYRYAHEKPTNCDELSLDELRQLPHQLERVESMSILGQRCQECGLRDLFMTIMKS